MFQKMRPRKRLHYLLGCFVLILLMAFGGFRVFRTSPSPLDHARPITDTTNWLAEPKSLFRSTPYFWSGRDDLTYFALGKDGNPHLIRQTGISKSDSKTVQEGPAVDLSDGGSGSLSQDGKWFIEWHENRSQQHVPTFLTMDGMTKRTGRPTWAEGGIWTPGSHPSLLCNSWSHRIGFEIYHPEYDTVQRLEDQYQPAFFSPEVVDKNGTILGFERGSSFMTGEGFTDHPSKSKDYVFLYRVDPLHPNTALSGWKIEIPANTKSGTCLLAPSGDQILWVLHSCMTAPILRKMKQYLPFLQMKPHTGTRWLISGIHGENMHQLAVYSEPASFQQDGLSPYSLPRWMPDSSHISFIHNTTLYTLPVD